MLGIRLSTFSSGLAPVALYSDMLTAGGSFADRQWFTSGASSGASNSISYGGGEVRIFSGASGRHCLCHFDCLKEQYPAYVNGTYQSGGILSATGVDGGSFSNGTFEIIQGSGSGGVITVLNGVISVTSAGTGYVDGSAIKAGGSRYNLVTGQVVYGGVYGHGLYRKTAGLAGNPIFTSPTNAQDGNGWTRYRPTARQIAEGGTLSISLKMKLDRTGFTITSNNAIRIGIFGSVGSYINYDNHGLSNSVFNGYSGYMFGYGPLDNRIHKRTETATPPLLSTTGGVYTQLSSTSISGFGGQNEYDVSINLKKIGSSLEITSHIYGSGYSSKFSHIDATPFTSFDTLAFYTVSNNVTSLAVSNPIAVYS